MIPEPKRNAVENALQATFGTSVIDDIRELTAGLSTALVYRIVVTGKPYLLRIIMDTSAMKEPTLEYNCMKAGAGAGIAPKVWYADTGERIAITDFVDAKPFPIDEAIVKMPQLLKRLHALPPFPFRINYLDAISGFIKKFRADGLMPDAMTDEIFGVYDKIKAIYPRNEEDLVACHNDLKPENTLFDGEQVWLVDWEAAFLNDRYMDLAIAANFLVRNDKDERVYLNEYFGSEPGEYQHARFYLARQMMHVSYFTAFILFAKTQGKPIDISKPGLSFRAFNDDVWSGKISLANMDNRVSYALVHRRQLLQNIQTKRFADSMAMLTNQT